MVTRKLLLGPGEYSSIHAAQIPSGEPFDCKTELCQDLTLVPYRLSPSVRNYFGFVEILRCLN